MRGGAAFAVAALAVLFVARSGIAQSSAPVQLDWQAPANCPQAAQVRQKLRDLLGPSASNAAPSRIRAEGRIEAVGERFRLTLNIHYDLVNGSRVVQANSCEDLDGVAAVTLALLFRAEHSSTSPLTARDLGGAASVAGTENQAANAANGAADAVTRAAADESRSTATASDELAKDAPKKNARVPGTRATHWQFAFRVPEFRTDIGALPSASYGLGLALGLRNEAWIFLASGTLWLAQDYEPGPFVGYGAHFGRVSGELSACRGWRFAAFELAPCLLLSLDDVSAHGTGVGISSSNPRTAWLSLGAGLQGLWSLGRNAALVFGVNGRIATSRPRFVSASLGGGDGEVAQVGAAALGALLGCQWLL